LVSGVLVGIQRQQNLRRRRRKKTETKTEAKADTAKPAADVDSCGDWETSSADGGYEKPRASKPLYIKKTEFFYLMTLFAN